MWYLLWEELANSWSSRNNGAATSNGKAGTNLFVQKNSSWKTNQTFILSLCGFLLLFKCVFCDVHLHFYTDVPKTVTSGFSTGSVHCRWSKDTTVSGMEVTEATHHPSILNEVCNLPAKSAFCYLIVFRKYNSSTWYAGKPTVLGSERVFQVHGGIIVK